MIWLLLLVLLVILFWRFMLLSVVVIVGGFVWLCLFAMFALAELAAALFSKRPA